MTVKNGIEIKAIIDFGSSGVKGFINKHPFYLESSIWQGEQNGWLAEDNWVTFAGQKYWLGDEKGQLYLSESKFEKALIKAIGFLAHGIKHLIEKKVLSQPTKSTRYDLSLGCFLPIGEASLKETFSELLRESLTQIETGWGNYRFKFKNLKVQPEGGGLLLGLKHQFNEANKAVLMMGFRNSSLLINSKTLNSFIPSDLGYATVVQRILANLGLPFENSYYRQLVMELKPKEVNLDCPLLKSEHPLFREKEREHLIKVIKQEHQRYLAEINNFLTENLNKTTIDHLCLGGGTAYFFKEEIPKVFTRYSSKLLWHGKLKLPEQISLPPCSDAYPQLNHYRWLDSYYMYHYLYQ